MADEKKSIFDKLGGKKKEEEEAKKLAESQAKADAARDARKVEALKKEAETAKAEAVKAKAEVDKVKADAEKAKADIEKAKVAAAAKQHQQEAADKAKELMAKREAEADAQKKFMEDAAVKAAKAAVIKHTWTNEDTYSSLAFKHYGSIKKPFWWLIYEHNKAIIGDNPNSIKTGTVIEIPPLPDELKDEKK